MIENRKPVYIKLSPTLGVIQEIVIQNPLEGEPISVEELLDLLSDETKQKIEAELRLRYINADTCDYPILPQFLTALYMKLKKIKKITVLFKELTANGRALAEKLGFIRKKEIVEVPSYQNLWVFIKKRLDENTIERISEMILKDINEYTNSYNIEFGSEIAHDGVVIRSHDKDAVYNKHYDTCMYKGEIGADINTLIPISGTATRGTDYDGNFAVPFAEKLDRIEKKERIGYFDGHYASLENFASLNHIHKIHPIINVPITQRRITVTGKLKNINKTYQKLHNKPDFIVNADLQTKLDLLLRYGKTDIVGYYYRNIHIKGFKKNMKKYGNRSLEETVNNSVKNGLVDIENGSNGTGIRNRDHHLRLCILTVQIVALIRLQKGVTTGLTSVKNIAC